MKQQTNIEDSWLSVIEDWKASGQSQKAFCLKRHLNYWQFRDRLKKSGWLPQKRRRPTKKGFVKVEPAVASAPAKPWLQVTLGKDGVRLQLNIDWGF